MILLLVGILLIVVVNKKNRKMKYVELSKEEMLDIQGGGIFEKFGAWCKKVYCGIKASGVPDSDTTIGGPGTNYVS
jgi:hypothetical protein